MKFTTVRSNQLAHKYDNKHSGVQILSVVTESLYKLSNSYANLNDDFLLYFPVLAN